MKVLGALLEDMDLRDNCTIAVGMAALQGLTAIAGAVDGVGRGCLSEQLEAWGAREALQGGLSALLQAGLQRRCLRQHLLWLHVLVEHLPGALLRRVRSLPHHAPLTSMLSFLALDLRAVVIVFVLIPQLDTDQMLGSRVSSCLRPLTDYVRNNDSHRGHTGCVCGHIERLL